ncbi:hypothetical protein BH23CHL5_BH23CHL5_16060 [soil metagenome]
MDVADSHRRWLAPRFAEMKPEHLELVQSHVQEVAVIDAALDSQLASIRASFDEMSLVSGQIRSFHESVRDQHGAISVLVNAMGIEIESPADEILEVPSHSHTSESRDDSGCKPDAATILRDAYSAFSLAAACYMKLVTVAMSVDSSELADVAERGLYTYAAAIQRIHQSLPAVMIDELALEYGEKVHPDACEQARKVIDRVWRATDQSSVPGGETL